MTEVDRDKIYDLLLQNFEHHPILSDELAPAMEFLRTLNIKQDNLQIVEGYNASKRIKKAYKSLKSEHSKALKIRIDSAVAKGGSKGHKLKGHPAQDNGDIFGGGE